MTLLPSRTQFQTLSARLPHWCMLLGLFLLISGARLWLIDRFGNATPFWDQWDHEVSIIKASLDGTLSPMLFFQAQNEHRIAFTQALVLLLFRANKQWDPILEMVAQLPLQVLTIVALVSMTARFMSGLGKSALAGFAACLGILPFGWENTLWGDQSCFYFMKLLGIVVVWLCWRYEALSARWWLGAFVAFASLFTMAGGVFSILAVIGFLAVRLILERRKEWRKQLAALVILSAIVLFGLAITPHVAPPGTMAATSFKSFFWALTGILSWPCNAHWPCLIIQAPFIVLALITLFRRVPFNDGRWFVIVAGTSFWIHAVATASLRVEGWGASRYRDSWSMLLIIACSCLYFLHRSLGVRLRFLFYPFAAAWILTCVSGLLDNAVNLWPRELMDKRSSMLEMENNVREYLLTGNATYLQGRIPYPNQRILRQRLSLGGIRRILPFNLIDSNPPLLPVKQTVTGDGFIQSGYPAGMPPMDKAVLGSYGKKGLQSQGAIALQFAVPRGTREVSLQVAGSPDARGMHLRVKEHHGASYSIAPPIDPGDHWQTVSINLKSKSTGFTIFGKDNSDQAWLAFSMPAISNGHTLGQWARSLANGSSYFIEFGSMLLIVGALGCMRHVPES